MRFRCSCAGPSGAARCGRDAVLQALRWYAEAGYPPREVERTTGMTPVELRRVDERIASLIGVADAPGSAD